MAHVYTDVHQRIGNFLPATDFATYKKAYRPLSWDVYLRSNQVSLQFALEFNHKPLILALVTTHHGQVSNKCWKLAFNRLSVDTIRKLRQYCASGAPILITEMLLKHVIETQRVDVLHLIINNPDFVIAQYSNQTKLWTDAGAVNPYTVWCVLNNIQVNLANENNLLTRSIELAEQKGDDVLLKTLIFNNHWNAAVFQYLITYCRTNNYYNTLDRVFAYHGSRRKISVVYNK